MIEEFEETEKILTKEDLLNSLQFVSLFIAIFESLRDYVIDCPKQLFGGCEIIRKDQIDKINEIEEKHKQDRIKAQQFLKECNKKEVSKERLKDIQCIAHYKHVKEENGDFVEWLSPEYRKLIFNRKVVIDKKQESSTTINSLMYFVDMKAITENDFNTFVELRKIRNNFVHRMQDYLFENVFAKHKKDFDKLISLYIKINNFWSTEFELSICGDDVPRDIEIDHINVITVELYNLLLAVDVLYNTNYMIGKEIRVLTGLYKCVVLPIKNKIIVK